MENENQKLVTPSGKNFELKSFMTARDRNALRAVYLQDVKVNPDSAQPQIDALAGELLERAESKLIELVVVSYDGVTEPAKVLEKLLDGSPADYDFVVAAANKVGNFTPAK